MLLIHTTAIFAIAKNQDEQMMFALFVLLNLGLASHRAT